MRSYRSGSESLRRAGHIQPPVSFIRPETISTHPLKYVLILPRNNFLNKEADLVEKKIVYGVFRVTFSVDFIHLINHLKSMQLM
jgi:hypothetical protein